MRDLDEAFDVATRLACEAMMLELGMISDEAVGRCHAASLLVTAWTANIAERVIFIATNVVEQLNA